MKNSIINLRLSFLENPHKKFWVSWGVLFKSLGVQKGTLLAKTMAYMARTSKESVLLP